MQFDVVTLFPEVFEPYFSTSILGRGKEAGLLAFQTHDLRKFGEGKHQTVDDTPYGGGAGMILKVEPIARALEAIDDETPLNPPFVPQDTTRSGSLSGEGRRRKIVVLSARGEEFTQTKAYEYAELDQITFICGRYEGIDQRVADHLADEELSIGPYVLAGGELAAMVVAEAVSRLVPGVLGNAESLKEESHSTLAKSKDAGRLTSFVEYPQYTKPEEFNGWTVPSVLLSGDHEKIRQWRKKQ